MDESPIRSFCSFEFNLVTSLDNLDARSFESMSCVGTAAWEYWHLLKKSAKTCGGILFGATNAYGLGSSRLPCHSAPH